MLSSVSGNAGISDRHGSPTRWATVLAVIRRILPQNE